MLSMGKQTVGQTDEEAGSAVCTHRPWGTFHNLFAQPGYQVKILQVKPGAALSLQYHHHREEVWTIASGVAEVTIDDRVMLLQAGETVTIPRLAAHRLRNPGGEILSVVEVQYGGYLGEDDIVRLADDYGRSTEPNRR